MKRIRVGAVQPRAFWGSEEHKNLDQAVAYVEEGVRAGAQLITFSEGYPGPSHGTLEDAGKPIAVMCDLARKHRVYIAASDLEPNPEIRDTYFLTLKLIAPTGDILANYKRVQPDHMYLNQYLHGGRMHVLPGNEIMVVPAELGNIGLQICSELFVPEISRIQMLKGAQIIIAPVNGQHSKTRPRLAETWRCVARARAAENLCYVIVTQNMFREEVQGVGIIAGPEETIATSSGPGLIVGDLDMDRLHWFRTRYYEREFFEEPSEAKPITRCRPGQIHDRRPELYGPLVQPQEDAFNYLYYKDGIDTWRREYDKVRERPLPRLA